jgi:hypothetical protein
MMDVRRLLVGFLVLASALALQSASLSATRDPPLVGRWQRTNTCQELVSALTKAGLGALTPYAWQGQTSSQGQSSFKPGSPKPTKAHPCTGAIARLHSHFFNAQGQFGSLDWLGGRVDDGTYTSINERTFRIGPVHFRFRIVNNNTLMLTPVLTKTMIRQALAHPAKFSPASWAVSVAYPGHTWKRVPCKGWC